MEPAEDLLGRRAEPVPQQRVPRLEEPLEGQGLGVAPASGPDQLDKGGEEGTPVTAGQVSGPVQGEGGRTVVLGQAGAGRVRRLSQQQVDDPGGEEVFLVDQLDVRPPAQRRQEPFQSLACRQVAENCPDVNSLGENLNPDRSAMVSSTASSVRRSTLACVISGRAGSSRLVPEKPDSSHAISTTAPSTVPTGGRPPCSGDLMRGSSTYTRVSFHRCVHALRSAPHCTPAHQSGQDIYGSARVGRGARPLAGNHTAQMSGTIDRASIRTRSRTSPTGAVHIRPAGREAGSSSGTR